VLFPALRDPVLLAAASFMLGFGLGCGQPLSTILTYNHSPPGRSGEALGMRLTVNKFTQIMVPLVFGSLGSAFGIFPIFWTSAALLLGGSFNNARHEKKDRPQAANGHMTSDGDNDAHNDGHKSGDKNGPDNT
jgi:MFS family permease